MAGPYISTVSGFPEWLPGTRRAEQFMLDVIRRKFELYGFTPIETPAVERLEVLDAKGGVGRQIFKVTRPVMEDEQSAAAVGLHFDLTVPLARYVIQHAHELTFPFRRYQIQKVWRGERAQRGRFREFYQCDIDVIGRGGLGVLYDAEIPCVINDIFSELGLGAFTIHVSNRRVLGALFSAMGLEDVETTLLRIIDRFHKVDRDSILQDLINEGLTLPQGRTILALVEVADLDSARDQLIASGADQTGIDELSAVVEGAVQLGMPREALRVDLSIARGLDYYTGTVFETFVTGREAWGSVCSGGRYDNLAAYFGDGTGYPGVGISIGLTRLVSLLEAEETLPVMASTPTQVLIANFGPKHLDTYFQMAKALRAASVPSEVFLGTAKLSDQLKYASDLGIPLVLIMGDREAESGQVVVRVLARGEQAEVSRPAVVEHVSSLLQDVP